MLSFHGKFVQTDRWTDRWTTVKEYAPILRYGGIKIKFDMKYAERCNAV